MEAKVNATGFEGICKLTSNQHFQTQAKPNFCTNAVSNLEAWRVKTKLYLNCWALGLLKSTAEQLFLKSICF